MPKKPAPKPLKVNAPDAGSNLRSQRIHFTALPNGAVGDEQRLSVAVTPQLKGPASLGLELNSFKPWTNWPQVVAGLSWQVGIEYDDTVKGEPKIVTVPAARVGDAPRQDLWAKLFPPDLAVTSYKPPAILAEQVLDFDSTAIHDYINGKLAEQQQGFDPPGDDDLRESFKEINVLGSTSAQVSQRIEGIFKSLDKNGFVSRKGVGIQRAALQMLAFNAPTLAPTRTAVRQRSARSRAFRAKSTPPVPSDLIQPPTKRPPRPTLTRFDFHAAVGALGSHPQLQRKLGLTIELGLVLPSDRPVKRIWVEPVGSMPTNAKLLPSARIYTLCDPKARGLQALPSTYPVSAGNVVEYGPPSEITDGMLRLSDPDYSLRQIEPDLLALKTMAAVAQVANGRQDIRRPVASVLTPRDQQPPPLPRTSGLSVVRAERAKALTHRFGRQSYLANYLDTSDSSGAVELHQEDITRGYAFDVFDESSGQWYSLCTRTGTAEFLADGSKEELTTEEGWVGGAVTQAKALGDATVRATEPIARWNHSWSLVTERPGRVMGPDEVPTAESGTSNIPLKVTYRTPPGTLPPQRVGRTYRVRARPVDLAGNVTSTAAADATGFKYALGPETLVRHEPVPAPAIVPRARMTEGESTDVVVIRSEGGPTNLPSGDVTERHVLPPAIDPWGAEQLGVFDGPDGPLAGFHALIAARADGRFDATKTDGSYVHPVAKADPDNLGQPFLDADEPRFSVEGELRARVPYLADPAAIGVLMRNLPDGDRDEGFYRGGKWPDAEPLLLRVSERAGGAPSDLTSADGSSESPHVLQVELARADDRIVDVSCIPAPAPAALGALANVSQFGSASAQMLASIRTAMLQGRHWAVSPARRLRLVHAVRIPLIATTFTKNLKLGRNAGESFVTLTDRMRTDRASTERVDVTATWYDKQDYLPPQAKSDDEAAWQPEQLVARSTLAFQRKIIREDEQNETLDVAESHELNHLRHIPEIEYTTEAASRFTEYFYERKTLTLTPGRATVIDARGIVANSELVSGEFAVTVPLGVVVGSKRKPAKLPPFATQPDLQRSVPPRPGVQTLRRGEDYIVSYETGTITARKALSGPVTIKYLPRPHSITSPAPVIRRAVSAVRPDAPKVLYAVPTFRREEVRRGTRLRHTHEPVGLRVYLDRPWWSSGDNEQLGVVCVDKGKAVPPGLEQLVTQRGQDPIWSSAPTTQIVKPGLSPPASRGALCACPRRQMGHCSRSQVTTSSPIARAGCGTPTSTSCRARPIRRSSGSPWRATSPTR